MAPYNLSLNNRQTIYTPKNKDYKSDAIFALIHIIVQWQNHCLVDYSEVMSIWLVTAI